MRSRTPDDEEWRARARSFGAVARHYDRARPSYPPALVEDVVAMLPGSHVVEVGAGTGKATVLFGVHGLDLTCIEPDPGMAAVLSENCRSLPAVHVVVSSFEEFEPAHPFDGLIAAQSWHWASRDQRYDKAAGLLRDGGLLALFWNRTMTHLSPLMPAINEVYQRRGLRLPEEPTSETDQTTWPADEPRALANFGGFEIRSYPSVHRYSTDEWIDYAASTSMHLVMDAEVRRDVLAEVGRVIEEQGDGVIEIHRRCDLYLARRL